MKYICSGIGVSGIVSRVFAAQSLLFVEIEGYIKSPIRMGICIKRVELSAPEVRLAFLAQRGLPL